MLTVAGYREAQRAADLRTCRHMLAGGSRSFYAASFLLPRRVRDPATALYAFCRLADDAIDQGGGAEALSQVRERLDLAYRGEPYGHAADRALCDVVARFGIPRDLPEGLIDGFAWDQAGRTYETIEDVLAYAARVAGTVGAMMAFLMGQRDPQVVARACDLGMAMQLTNIARDIGEDAHNGRLYLPRAWLRAEGINPDAWLAAPCFSPQLAAVTGRLLRVADDLYARADEGIARLPADCRPGITAARLLYAEIGHEVERQGRDSVSSRAVVSGGRKVALLLSAMNVLTRTAAWRDLPSIPAAEFLVEAARNAPHQRLPALAWWDVRGRLLFVLDLFERLERREQIYRISQDRTTRTGPVTA